MRTETYVDSEESLAPPLALARERVEMMRRAVDQARDDGFIGELRATLITYTLSALEFEVAAAEAAQRADAEAPTIGSGVRAQDAFKRLNVAINRLMRRVAVIPTIEKKNAEARLIAARGHDLLAAYAKEGGAEARARAEAVLLIGLDPNETGALFLAAREGRAEMVDLLLEFGAVPDSDSLDAALAGGHAGIVRALVGHGARFEDTEEESAEDKGYAALRLVAGACSDDEAADFLLHLLAYQGAPSMRASPTCDV